jgi:hypothetical protein
MRSVSKKHRQALCVRRFSGTGPASAAAFLVCFPPPGGVDTGVGHRAMPAAVFYALFPAADWKRNCAHETDHSRAVRVPGFFSVIQNAKSVKFFLLFFLINFRTMRKKNVNIAFSQYIC